VKDNNY